MRTAFRRLYLLRHATAVPADGIGDEHDFARVLSGPGLAEARAVGEKVAAWLAARTAALPEPLPEDGPMTILASPARRTSQTAGLVAQALERAGRRAAVVPVQALYNASCETIGHVLRMQADSTQVMLVGHNPGLYQLAAELAGEAIDRPDMALLTQGYPPATLACFDITGDWSALSAGTARVTGVLAPG